MESFRRVWGVTRGVAPCARPARYNAHRVYAVFCQSSSPVVDGAALVANAERLFRTTLRVDVGRVGSEVHLVRTKPPLEGRFVITARAATAHDWDLARQAEARGHAAGMSTLAARCSTIWEIRAEDERAAACFLLCAIVASVCLGPVLPPDRATLFGVRGALERSDRAASS